jgi:hypothetical protein
MKRWIEGLSRLEDAEGDMDEFAHHGADDDQGYLAGASEPKSTVVPAQSKITA